LKLFGILLFISVNCYADAPSQTQVRALFKSAVTDEHSCRNMVKLLEGFKENNNTLLGGYKACATIMMAKYVFNPFSKLSYFLKGKSLLEKCISSDKNNIELRLLRIIIQTKAPFFLGYRSSMDEDRSILMRSLGGIHDIDLKKMITTFLTTEGYLN
jgi:hypothetical protein